MIGPGTELGGFAIESIAGRGGMGVVYRARQRLPDRIVALKVISSEYADDPQFRTRFEREAAIAAQIEHPNVIPVHAVGEADGTLFIAMRFVDGVDLRKVLTQEGRLEPEPGRGDRRPGGAGARRGPRARAGAPRRQARQHPGLLERRPRARVPVGLRARAAHRRQPRADGHRGVHRHDRLRGSRAGSRRPRRRARGRLLAWLRACFRRSPEPCRSPPTTTSPSSSPTARSLLRRRSSATPRSRSSSTRCSSGPWPRTPTTAMHRRAIWAAPRSRRARARRRPPLSAPSRPARRRRPTRRATGTGAARAGTARPPRPPAGRGQAQVDLGRRRASPRWRSPSFSPSC